MTQVSLPAFPSRTNLKMYNYVPLKLAEKFMTNLELSKASDSDCCPVLVLKKCDFHTC